MNGIFEKLNLTDQQEILVLHAPESFLPELARLPVLTIHHHIESVPKIGFFLAFVTRKSEVDALASAVAVRAVGDAIVWFAYPKGTSKKYTCDFNRDTGWDALQALGFNTVRAIAIDEDWSALRFRRVEYIKSASSIPRKPTEATEPAPLAEKNETEKTECKTSPTHGATRKPKSTAQRTTRI
jgi:hypothetical protein